MSLGIDFGTTRTVVAYADRGNYPVISFFDGAGDACDWFPSVVAERGGELRFGFDALAVAEDPSFTVARSFKRFLSDPRAIPETPVHIGDTTLPLGDLVTRFLLALRDALRTRSNIGVAEPPTRAVVAVPANAHGAQRFVTLDAFRRAGFDVVAMLNEPSAAGFEYTHRHRDTLTSRRDHVVVYDLGGGTFAASLVKMSGLDHEVVVAAGLSRLGGDDFDDALADLVLARAGRTRTAVEPRALARLLDQCRDAKERLNPSSRKIALDLAAAGVGDGDVAIPVADYYAVCAPLIERSIEAMLPVMARTEGLDAGAVAEGAKRGRAPSTEATADSIGRRAASTPALSPFESIAGIYVVGGASELPIVARALRERFGRRVHRSPYPSAAVAIGLAIASDERSGFALTDRFSRTFGVFREGEAGQEITFDPIFTAESVLPARGAAPRTSRRVYRAAHNVGHFRFFECGDVDEGGRPRGDIAVSGDVLFPFDGALAEDGDLAGVPVQRQPGGGPQIEEEYALDASGIVKVTIRNVDAGYAREYRLGARTDVA